MSVICTLAPASVFWIVLAIQDKKVNEIPAHQLTEAFLITCRGEENGGFHIQETHARDKESK